jgi:hypothetical protein
MRLRAHYSRLYIRRLYEWGLVEYVLLVHWQFKSA